ncbi:MAG: adenylate/guanylate cyclase domain-containing protein [Desulfobacteraceae bacterium]|nr:adenylate/guanylate cyclase domain-containing protein [Desulfobacteraceae bacterium]
MKLNKNLFFSPFSMGSLLIILSCLVFYSFGNQKPGFLSGLDNKIVDIMFQIRGPQPISKKVIIVDIDEKSLKQLGQWPWPRHILADLTRVIHNNGAKVIGFDIVFPEADRTSPARYLEKLKPILKEHIPNNLFEDIMESKTLDHDIDFGNAVAQSRVILGYAFQLKNDGLKSATQVPFSSVHIRLVPETQVFKNLSLLSAYRAILNIESVSTAASEGFFNVLTDDSGTVRQVPLLMEMDQIPYPSLALETWRLGMKIPLITIHTDSRIKTVPTPILGLGLGHSFIPTTNNCQMVINHRGPFNTFPYISAGDLLAGRSHPDLKDKFILVGSSATGLFDLKATPFSSTMPGIEINATIIDNLIQGDPFKYDLFTEIGITYLLILAGGFLLNLILSFSRPLTGAVGALLFFLFIFAGNYYFFFLNNQLIGITFPFDTFLILLVLVNILNYVREGRAKRYIQNAFSHYIAPDVVKALVKNPKQLSLAGEQKELTVLFSDIRGFTSISEKMDSRVLGKFMNQYLTQMSHIIMENKGTVDKFIGDAIMAFWGAPNDEPDHAGKAVQTALLMKSHLIKSNQKLKNQGMPEIHVGIGINSGIMSVGNFGSQDRFDYTVMGDNVNLASRLEEINKTYGTTILVSEFTKEKLKDRFSFHFIDKVMIRGRKQRVQIYEPFVKDTPPRKDNS